MTATTTAPALPPAEETTAAPAFLRGEASTILPGVSWRTYESLLEDFAGRPSPRFAFDAGVLEIMSPLLPAHEKLNRLLARLVDVLAEEWGIETVNFGSTTFRRQDRGQGVEPDTCFYMNNLDWAQRAQRVNLQNGDPVPDLAIELDVTSPSLPRLPIYAALGVPEVWRHDGGRVTILVLDGGEYRESTSSVALPLLTADRLNEALTDGLAATRTLDWVRGPREWARRQQAPPAGAP
jgi:Uma2 family endonuclease